MSRSWHNQDGKMLLRFVSLLFLVLLGFAGPASAEGPVDVSTIASKTNITQLLRRLATEQSSIRVELPPDANGKADILDLQASGTGPPFKWAIIALVNRGTVAKNMVLAIDHQKFAGSRLLFPLPPGSIVKNIVHSGLSSPARISALGQDAFEFAVAPSASQSIAVQIDNEPTTVTLWDHEAFNSHVRSLAFFQGALLGVSILLGISMLMLFVARAKASFLSCAVFAFSTVAFMAFEVGYLSQPQAFYPGFQIAPHEARAVIETMMAVGLLLCLSSLADLRHRMPVVRNALLILAGFGAALAVYGFVEPFLVAGIARMAFAAVALVGFFILLRLRRERPADSALVVWSAVVIWTLVAATAAFARSDIAPLSPGLLVSLLAVLIILSYRFFRSAATHGFLSRRQSQEMGRRDLALAGAQQYVWDYYPEDRDLYVSEELEQALGQPKSTFGHSTAETFSDLMHPADRAAYATTLAEAERHGRGSITQELRLRRGDGSYRWFELRARGLASTQNRLVRCIGTLSDITNAKRTEERLLKDAVYDQVTGLPNRALFLDRLKREMAKPRSTNLYVILIDIDRFKAVNDGLGNDAGDSLLTSLGRRIEALLGPNDTVARLPGDQFAVLFTESISGGDVNIFTDRVHEAIAKPVAVNQQEIFLTACLGAASFREESTTPEQLMKDAAIALYEAKRRGKEMFAIFQPSMRDDRSELVALESELRRALERNEIEVHYQPIARLIDMDLAGFEALVRWRHPVLGLLAPESFLGLAEQTGMIKDIGRFVLNEATHQLGIWQRAFRPNSPVFMAVNVSASQLVETDLVLDIRAAIGREAVYKQTLKIEITESVVMQSPERAAGILEQIKQLGVGLACDDFGTGYSSLSSLRNLPFDTLKVDRSFIVPDPDDERASVILEAIISLAHSLGLAVVAEGIEDQSQVDRLGALQCDYVQGFFIGPPMTAKKITESLGSMPYVKAYGKTAISTLWERAKTEPEVVPNDREFTTEDIDQALARQSGLPAAKNDFPQLGLSPMAPRTVQFAPEELPTIFKTTKISTKPRKKRPKKAVVKAPPEEPSSVT
jgi:diguanylate cyclase (GGDEF)-like protein/PAS domain S-box-containing protein